MEQESPSPEPARKSHVLASWKEIADYLGVNLRTAQKWERIHRLPVSRRGGRRSRVNADAAELDDWRHGRERITAVEDQSYRWPLGNGVTVELRFLGTELGAGHIDLLRDYLDIFKKSIESPRTL